MININRQLIFGLGLRSVGVSLVGVWVAPGLWVGRRAGWCFIASHGLARWDGVVKLDAVTWGW